jgi:hypothetical protein
LLCFYFAPQSIVLFSGIVAILIKHGELVMSQNICGKCGQSFEVSITQADCPNCSDDLNKKTTVPTPIWAKVLIGVIIAFSVSSVLGVFFKTDIGRKFLLSPNEKRVFEKYVEDGKTWKFENLLNTSINIETPNDLNRESSKLSKEKLKVLEGIEIYSLSYKDFYIAVTELTSKENIQYDIQRGAEGVGNGLKIQFLGLDYKINIASQNKAFLEGSYKDKEAIFELKGCVVKNPNSNDAWALIVLYDLQNENAVMAGKRVLENTKFAESISCK